MLVSNEVSPQIFADELEVSGDDFVRVCSCDFLDRSVSSGGNDPLNHTKQHERSKGTKWNV